MSTRGELRRQLGLGSAVALVVGEVIGVGIFLTPAGMAKALGSPLWLLAVWLVAGGVTLAGALCLGELAARYPAAGGGHESGLHTIARKSIRKSSARTLK